MERYSVVHLLGVLSLRWCTMPKRLPLSMKHEVQRLLREGQTDTEVAAKAGCARQTVARIRTDGIATDRTTKGRVLQVRVSQKEAEAFETLLAEQNMTASEVLRRMIRMAEGVVDFRGAEVAELHQASTQLNAMARNLVQMLQLGHVGKLRWNARDNKLVAQLADRTEEVARAVQAMKAAAQRSAFTRSADLARGLVHG